MNVMQNHSVIVILFDTTFVTTFFLRQSRKQLKKLEKNLKSGKCDISKENAFDVFMLSTAVKYCSFSDSRSVLGNTYGMCVIQVGVSLKYLQNYCKL